MRRLFAWLISAALTTGSAHAAPTEIFLHRDVPALSGLWDLSITISDPVSVGAIAFLVQGATGFVFNPALTTGAPATISLADSVNSASSTNPGAWHVAGNPPNLGQVMFQGPAAGMPPLVFLIGTFTVPLGPDPSFLSSAPDGGAIQDPDFNELPSVMIVPEPMNALMLGPGLALLALARRRSHFPA